jgi:hypothetical protein
VSAPVAKLGDGTEVPGTLLRCGNARDADAIDQSDIGMAGTIKSAHELEGEGRRAPSDVLFTGVSAAETNR